MEVVKEGVMVGAIARPRSTFGQETGSCSRSMAPSQSSRSSESWIG